MNTLLMFRVMATLANNLEPFRQAVCTDSRREWYQKGRCYKGKHRGTPGIGTLNLQGKNKRRK